MTYTACTSLLELAQLVGHTRTSTTTSAGGSTKAVDSNRTELKDYWAGGTIIFNASPSTTPYAGLSRPIISSSGTSGDIAWTDTIGYTAASGVSYSVIEPDWPRDKLYDFINMGLRDMGTVPQYNSTMSTVANQEEYTLPTGVSNVKRVEIATSSTTAFYYTPNFSWIETTEGKLRFLTGCEPAESDYKIRVTYVAPHVKITTDSNTISDYVPIDRLVWEAAVHAWRWKLQTTKGEDNYAATMMSEAILTRDSKRKQWPVQGTTYDPLLSL